MQERLQTRRDEMQTVHGTCPQTRRDAECGAQPSASKFDPTKGGDYGALLGHRSAKAERRLALASTYNADMATELSIR